MIRKCQFEPCPEEFDAKKTAGGIWQSWCPKCVKRHVWMGGSHGRRRIKEIENELSQSE